MNSKTEQNRGSNFLPVVSNQAFRPPRNKSNDRALWFCLHLSFCLSEIHWIPPVIKSNQPIEKTNSHYLGSSHLTECSCLWVSAVVFTDPLMVLDSGLQSVLCSSLITAVNQNQLRRHHSHYLIAKQCHSIVNCTLPLSPPRLLRLQTGPVSVKW